MSVRKACQALRIDRSLYTYKSMRGEQAGLKQRIKEICETRVRYGYRRVHVLLVREGWAINMKRTRRLYNELGLQLRNKTPKRRVKAKLRDDRTEATRCNQTRATDFVHDQLATGRKRFSRVQIAMPPPMSSIEKIGPDAMTRRTSSPIRSSRQGRVNSVQSSP